MLLNTAKVITTVVERYLSKYCDIYGVYTDVVTEGDKVKFIGWDGTWERYETHFYAWIDQNDELHLENDRGDSFFDFAEENEWTEYDVLYMKYGEEKARQMTRTNQALQKLKTALESLRSAWYECCDAIGSWHIEANDYICGDEEGREYPFDKSFDELKVIDWVDGAIKKIEEDMY